MLQCARLQYSCLTQYANDNSQTLAGKHARKKGIISDNVFTDKIGIENSDHLKWKLNALIENFIIN